MDDSLSWLEHPLDVRKGIGSSPISSTIKPLTDPAMDD